MSTSTQQLASATSNGATRSRLPDDFVSLDGMLTVEQWAALPDTKPRYELIEGRLVQKMTTTTRHAWAAGRFLIACDRWGEEHGWQFFPEGTGLKINKHTGHVPDVVGFAPDVTLDPEASYNDHAFLVVEVLSKSTAEFDRTDKKQNYAIIGVPLYVIVDTNTRTIEAYRLQNGTYGDPEVLQENDVWQPAELPGLRVELNKLWLK